MDKVEIDYELQIKRYSEYVEYFLENEEKLNKLIMEKEEYIKKLEQSLNETLGWNKHFKEENGKLRELLKEIDDLIDEKLKFNNAIESAIHFQDLTQRIKGNLKTMKNEKK